MTRGIRCQLLLTGMGCFLFAVGVTLVNVLLLPYERACHGIGGAQVLLPLALTVLLLGWLGRRLRAADEGRLLRVRAVAVPVFLIGLFGAQALLGYLMAYTPAGDNHAVYVGAQLLAGEGSLVNHPDYALYFARYENQWGFTLMLSAVWRLCSLLGIADAAPVLVLLQAALYVPGMCAGLSVMRTLRGVRGELMLLAAAALCLPLLLAAAVLYTDTFSLPFVLIALDWALRALRAGTLRRQLGCAAVCGLAVLIGAQIKMTVLIVLIAAVLCWLLSARPARALAMCALSAAIVLSGTAAARSTALRVLVDPQVHAQQRMPILHWVMMSVPRGDNPYGNAPTDYNITWKMMDEGASREEIMRSICTRLKDRVYTLRYPNRLIAAALRKNVAFAGDGTFGMTEMLDDNPVRPNAVSEIVLEGGAHFPAYKAVCTGAFAAQLLLAWLGCLRDIRRRDTRAALLYVAFFGIAFFLMLWEARSRYLFSFVPVALMLCACRCVDGGLPGKEDARHEA
ncbi:MAG: hypothetical protein ACI4PG_04470 [Candidatus Ventricola sp.]